MEYRLSKSRLAEETNKAWGSEITLTETASSILKLVFYLQEFFAKKKFLCISDFSAACQVSNHPTHPNNNTALKTQMLLQKILWFEPR